MASTVAELVAVISADTSGFDSAVSGASEKLNEFAGQAGTSGKAAGQNWSQGLQTGGKMAAGIGAIMLAPIADMVRGAASLEKAMDTVGVAFNATDEQAARLENTINDVASNTVFGLKEVADAATILGRAGVSSEDAIDGVLQATADFAAATGTQLPTAADIMARTSMQWGKSGQEMIGVADDLTTVFNATALDAEDFLGGMANFAPIMRLAGATLEETAAAMGFFKNQGLSAREAGTSLTRAMDAMIAPTDKQAAAMANLGITTEDFFEVAEDGTRQFIGWADTFDMLNEQMADFDNISKAAFLEAMFGKEAFDAMGLGMLADTELLRDLNAEMENNTGIARKQSEALTDNLLGSLEKLGGSYDVLKSKMGDPFLGPLKAGVDGLNEVVDAMADLDPALLGLVSKFASLSGGLLLTGGTAAWGTGKVLELGEAFKKAGFSLPKFAAGLGLVGLAIGAGLLAYETDFLGFRGVVDGALEDAGKAIDQFGETFQEVFNAQQAKGMNDLANTVDSFGKALFDATGLDIMDQTSALGRGIDALTKSFEENAADGVDPWVNALESAGDAARAMDNEQLASELDRGSLAWGAMADSMRETEGQMPQLNRELSALQAGMQELTGLPVEDFFDDLGTNLGTTQRNLTELKDALAAGDLGGFGQLLIRDQPELQNFFDTLGGNLSTTKNNLTDLKEAFGDWGELGQLLIRDQPKLQEFFDNLGSGVDDLRTSIGDVDLQADLQGVSDQLFDWFNDIGRELFGGLDSMAGPGEREVAGLIPQLADSIVGGFEGLGDAVGEKLGGIGNPFEGVGQWLQDGLDQIANFFQPQEMTAGLGGAGFGDTSGIQQWFDGMLQGFVDAIPTKEDIGAALQQKGADFMTAIGDNILGPLGQFIFPSQDAIAAEGSMLGDPAAVGEQFGQSLINTFSDPAFSDGLNAAIEELPDEVFSGTGASLLGAINEGMKTAMLQATPSEGGGLPTAPIGQQMVQTMADGLATSLQAEDAAQRFIPAVNAFGSAFNRTFGQAMTSTLFAEGQGGKVGADAAGGIGAQMVQSLADGLTTSLMTEGVGERFIPAVNALGTALNTAMQSASQQAAQQTGDQTQAGQQAAGGFGQQMVQGLATGLTDSIIAAPPELFIPVTNALGTQLGAAMSMAAQQTAAPGPTGVPTQVPGMGLGMVEGLATGLTDSITAAPVEAFHPVANALGSKLSESLGMVMTQTLGVGGGAEGGLVGADAAGGIGQQMVQGLATGLADSVTNAPTEVFTPVGSAVGTKLSEALRVAVGEGDGTGAADVGAQLGDSVGQMLISGVQESNWDAVGTSLGTKISETLQTAAQGEGATDISQQLGDSVGQMMQAGVEQADWTGVGDAVSTQMTEQMDTAIQEVSTSVEESMGQMTEAVSESVNQMGEAVGQATEQVSSAVEEMSSTIESATEAVSQAVQEMSAAVEEAGASMEEAASQAVAAADEIGTAASEAAAAVSAAMQEMAAAVQAAAGAIQGAAGQIVAALNQIAGAAAAASSAVGAVGSMPVPSGGATGTGRSLATGVAEGMDAGAPVVEAASRAMADVAYDALADAVEMGSPARRFEPVGRSIAQGMVKGMLSEAKARLKEAMGRMAGAVESAMGKIKSAMASGMGRMKSMVSQAMGRVKGEAGSAGQEAGAAAARGAASGIEREERNVERAARKLWKKALKELLDGKGEMRFLGEEFAREFWLGMLDTAGSLEFARFVTAQAVAAAEDAIEAIKAKIAGLAVQFDIVSNAIADIESELDSINSQLASMDAAAAEEAARAAGQARIDAAQELLDRQREITAELQKQFESEFSAAHQANIRNVQNRGRGGTKEAYEAALAKATATKAALDQSKILEERLAKELEMIRKAVQAEAEARAEAARATARAELEARKAMLEAELAEQKRIQAEIAAAQHAAQVEYTNLVIEESNKRIEQIEKELKKADDPEKRARLKAELELERQKLDLANQLAAALERQAAAKTPEELALAKAEVEYLTAALAALEEVDVGAMLQEIASTLSETASSMSSAADSMSSAADSLSSMDVSGAMKQTEQAVAATGTAASQTSEQMFSMGAKYKEVMDKMSADGWAFQAQFQAMTDKVRGGAEEGAAAIGTALSDGITQRIEQGGEALRTTMVDGLQRGIDETTQTATQGADSIATAFGQSMRDELGVQLPQVHQNILDGMKKSVDETEKLAGDGGKAIGDEYTGRLKAEIDQGTPKFQTAMTKGVNDPMRGLANDAGRGGRDIGTAFADGIQNTVRDRARGIADEAARTVREAVQAARQAADANSPSRKMMALGDDMVLGLIYGLRGRREDAKDASRELVYIPSLSPTSAGGVSGRRAWEERVRSTVIQIDNLNLPNVTNPREFVAAMETLANKRGTTAGRPR